MISIAPMLGLTNRHCRYLHRLLTKHALLYSEMISTGAILHGDQKRFLMFNSCEHPIALQLGGSDPHDLARCAKICEDFSYDEINLNVGCPSKRVQAGQFGAFLMLQPELVAECIFHMQQAVQVPVSVKMRLGVDAQDSYDELRQFIQIVSDAGCQKFIIHARKAYLRSCNPKQNRTKPQINYDSVYRIKKDFSHLKIIK